MQIINKVTYFFDTSDCHISDSIPERFDGPNLLQNRDFHNFLFIAQSSNFCINILFDFCKCSNLSGKKLFLLSKKYNFPYRHHSIRVMAIRLLQFYTFVFCTVKNTKV